MNFFVLISQFYGVTALAILPVWIKCFEQGPIVDLPQFKTQKQNLVKFSFILSGICFSWNNSPKYFPISIKFRVDADMK